MTRSQAIKILREMRDASAAHISVPWAVRTTAWFVVPFLCGWAAGLDPTTAVRAACLPALVAGVFAAVGSRLIFADLTRAIDRLEGP